MPVPEFIKSSETIDLRHRILRPNQDLTICHYAEDDLSSTFHLGIRGPAGQIIANGTFIKQNHQLFQQANCAYRLRGMATDSDFQKQGFGKAILEKGQQELLKRNCDLLWFNARLIAEEFYAKLGFSANPVVFDIPGANLHKVMYKWL